MRKLIIAVLTVSLLVFGNAATANTPDIGTQTATPIKMPSSIIDGIEVPYDVIEYAQVKYQGHAITQVSRSYRDGQRIYELRVDNDDQLYDDDCIFLWYDMKWKLLDEGKAEAAPEPESRYFDFQPEQSSEVHVDESRDTPEPEQEQEHEEPRERPRPEPNDLKPEPEEDVEDGDEPDWPPRGRGWR